jgi:hypothetical protein
MIEFGLLRLFRDEQFRIFLFRSSSSLEFADTAFPHPPLGHLVVELIKTYRGRDNGLASARDHVDK